MVDAAKPMSVDEKIKKLIDKTMVEMPRNVQTTMPRIDGIPRQILALRGYLRKSDEIDTRWAWSEEEAREFDLSAVAWQLAQSINAVKTKFETDNPDLKLTTTEKFRPLDRQIQLYNQNKESVLPMAAQLREAVASEIAQYPDEPTPQSIAKFKKFLRGCSLSGGKAGNATPGLSSHGQSRAIDFVIKRNGQQAASLSTNPQTQKREWDDTGLTQKLNDAVRGSVNEFNKDFLGSGARKGEPREPWHYDFESHTPVRWDVPPTSDQSVGVT